MRIGILARRTSRPQLLPRPNHLRQFEQCLREQSRRHVVHRCAVLRRPDLLKAARGCPDTKREEIFQRGAKFDADHVGGCLDTVGRVCQQRNVLPRIQETYRDDSAAVPIRACI